VNTSAKKSSPHGKKLGRLLQSIPDLLIADQPLPERCRDHALTGEWKDHRDCHVRPDLILITGKLDDGTLQPVRLGSHSEVSL